jgi:SAM-dependent methyltransferase
MAQYEYPLDNEWKAARERLAMLEAAWDPWTKSCLLKVGVGEGWRCLEIAGGGGSIGEWLCRRVGSNGHVVATDLQPHFLQAIEASNLKVMRHNIIEDALPEKSFDLVHARALLTFLPDPALALAKMVAALKPGGWLLVEEPDYVSGIPDPSMLADAVALSQKAWDAMLGQLRSQGYKTELGRHLYHDVAITGLANIQAEGFVGMQLAGTPWARFWRITFEQLEQRIQNAGLLSADECNEYRRLLDSLAYRWMNPICMSVWGQRS